MKYNAIFLIKEYIDQMKVIQEAVNIAKSPAIQDAIRVANNPAIRQVYQLTGLKEDFDLMQEQFSRLQLSASNCLKTLFTKDTIESYKLIAQSIEDSLQAISQLNVYEFWGDSFRYLREIIAGYDLIHYYPDDMSDEETEENEKANSKIISEIFKLERERDQDIHKQDSVIIALSPINDAVLKYLSENPQTLYCLTSRKFEEVMAEIYNRLGYKVELTKATKDGGKDIILRKPDILGDFVYYVECKKYSLNNPVGVGIVREFSGVINMDRVNGGIIATTSYFAKDARNLILDHDLSFQIKLHDYDKIKGLLGQVF